MQPSLVYIDSQSGALLGEYRLPVHKLSIRHIDVNSRGLVAVTTQYQGEAQEQFPLLASHSGEDNLTFFDEDSYPWPGLQNYCGAVAFAKSSRLDINGDLAVVTSPRGGRVALIDFKDQTAVASFRADDVCGVGFCDVSSSFILSSGRGFVYRLDLAGGNKADLSLKRVDSQYRFSKEGQRSPLFWDNHLLVV